MSKLKKLGKKDEQAIKQAEVLKEFLTTLQLTSYLSTKIDYIKIENNVLKKQGWFKNVLITGIIGNGKSTFCNEFSG